MFYQALKKYMPSDSLDKFLKQSLEAISLQQGFLSEIRSKKWIYKGEQLQRLPAIEADYFEVYFLPKTALL